MILGDRKKRERRQMEAEGGKLEWAGANGESLEKEWLRQKEAKGEGGGRGKGQSQTDACYP